MKNGSTLQIVYSAICSAVLALVCTSAGAAPALVQAVDSITILVLDADRSIDFYSRVLSFRKISDREVTGDAYEHLFDLFGLRVRLVRIQLGDESLERSRSKVSNIAVPPARNGARLARTSPAASRSRPIPAR